jgi:hypothetical protein
LAIISVRHIKFRNIERHNYGILSKKYTCTNTKTVKAGIQSPSEFSWVLGGLYDLEGGWPALECPSGLLKEALKEAVGPNFSNFIETLTSNPIFDKSDKLKYWSLDSSVE